MYFFLHTWLHFPEDITFCDQQRPWHEVLVLVCPSHLCKSDSSQQLGWTLFKNLVDLKSRPSHCDVMSVPLLHTISQMLWETKPECDISKRSFICFTYLPLEPQMAYDLFYSHPTGDSRKAGILLDHPTISNDNQIWHAVTCILEQWNKHFIVSIVKLWIIWLCTMWKHQKCTTGSWLDVLQKFTGKNYELPDLKINVLNMPGPANAVEC